MRALAFLPLVLLASCGRLLGIDNPSPAADDGGPIPDVPVIPTVATDKLVFSLTSFQIATAQVVRVHVMLVHQDQTMQDVTAAATYTSDSATTATVDVPGQIKGLQAGSAMITASLGVAMPATANATVTAAKCHLVINELMTGNTTAADEWVEIYNPCANTVDVAGWTLAYRAAGNETATDDRTMATLAGQMMPGDFRVFAGKDFKGTQEGSWQDTSGIMQQVSAAVALRVALKDGAGIVDSIAYGMVAPLNPFIEANPTPVMANGKSASRLPFDGNDNNNNVADFMIITTATPHAPNVP